MGEAADDYLDALERAADIEDDLGMAIPEGMIDPVEAAAEIERLREALRQCADDLEAELNSRYQGTLDCESQKRKYDADMEKVARARRALKGTPHD